MEQYIVDRLKLRRMPANLQCLCWRSGEALDPRMNLIVRFTTQAVLGVILATGVAGAGLTHATGAGVAEVSAIKAAVIGLRHVEPTAIDWYIAVSGPNAVAYDGCGPGACDETQLFRRDGHWVVTCYTVEGKGRFGRCTMPASEERRLRRAALTAPQK